MGYRDAWLNHADLGSRHYEVVIHAIERCLPTSAARVLVAGVENGGCLQVWRQILPEGSEAIGVDIDPRCADLGLGVRIGDVLDDGWLRAEFRDGWFDLIIDSTGTMTPWLWPFLAPGGRLILEGYDDRLLDLLGAVIRDSESWLPVEEIMRCEVYPHVAVIEKRFPRVMPYQEIMVGNFLDVVPETALAERGVRRVIV